MYLFHEPLPALVCMCLQPQNRPVHPATQPEWTTRRQIWHFCFFYHWQHRNQQHGANVTAQSKFCNPAFLQPQAWIQPQDWLQPQPQAQPQFQVETIACMSALQLSGSQQILFTFSLLGQILHFIPTKFRCIGFFFFCILQLFGKMYSILSLS